MRQEVYVKFAEALAKKAGELKRDAVVKQAERVDTFLRSVGVVPSVKRSEQDARVDGFLRSIGVRGA